jgi:hypothetical protein
MDVRILFCTAFRATGISARFIRCWLGLHRRPELPRQDQHQHNGASRVAPSTNGKHAKAQRVPR